MFYPFEVISVHMYNKFRNERERERERESCRKPGIGIILLLYYSGTKLLEFAGVVMPELGLRTGVRNYIGTWRIHRYSPMKISGLFVTKLGVFVRYRV